MHDDTVLVAIDTALRAPAFCQCGTQLMLVTHDDAAWLECSAYARPSRLPARVAAVVREFLHERRFVIELPEAEAPAPPPVTVPATIRRSTLPAGA